MGTKSVGFAIDPHASLASISRNVYILLPVSNAFSVPGAPRVSLSTKTGAAMNEMEDEKSIQSILQDKNQKSKLCKAN